MHTCRGRKRAAPPSSRLNTASSGSGGSRCRNGRGRGRDGPRWSSRTDGRPSGVH